MCLSEAWVNELAIIACTVGVVIAILVGRLTDKIRGYMKVTIMTLLGLATVVFLILSLISLKVIILPKMIDLK